jgi:hypothetical protein
MTTAVLLSPVFNNDHSVSDANGDPRSGAHLHTYLAGTSTPVTTYKESTGSTAHTNPIILDANGLPPAPIWLPSGVSQSYKFVLAPSTDTTPPVSALLTIDNVVAINDASVAAATTEWTVSGMTPTYISATSFSVATDQTTILHVGRRLKITVTAGTVYATIIRSVYTSLTTVTVLTDSGSVDSGISAFSYGIASADNTSLPFVSRDQQCGRLGYVSATSIRLDPQDGNTIWVNSGSSWRRRIIPSAGISAANTSIYIDGSSGQNLAASTTYYVYLFDNAGVLTMDFSTTAPAVDATSGLKIKTGVATRLLIGMVRTNASSQFQANGIGVLSWYKRRNLQVTGAALSAASTNSTSFVELQVAAEVKFLSWAEEAIQASFVGNAYMDAVGRVFYNYVTLDGISTVIGALVAGTSYANLAQLDATCGGFATVAEGYHYVTLTAKVSAGVGNWDAGVLQVMTRG